MKFTIKNYLIFIIICIIVVIFEIKFGLYFLKRNNNIDAEKLIGNAYIDIWEQHKTLHYIINKNGDIYTYQDNSNRNTETVEKEPATIKYIKKLSKSDVKNIENESKSIAEKHKVDSSLNIANWFNYWYIKINGETTKVNVNVYQKVLEQYFDENNYSQRMYRENLENSIHDYIKENYTIREPLTDLESFDMSYLTDEEKNEILNEYKNRNHDIELTDDELLFIIDSQAHVIWVENLIDSYKTEENINNN